MATGVARAGAMPPALLCLIPEHGFHMCQIGSLSWRKRSCLRRYPGSFRSFLYFS